ncbi:hypothetical protein DL770_006877 [Monosporascus sp. CRB-9-2]|nr:hypothetical protein DL770_006877 [Monosporascus sp. CRB-9-2]
MKTGLTIEYSVGHFCKRVSAEALMGWFHNVHLPAGVPLMKKQGIVKYAVLSVTCEIPRSAPPSSSRWARRSPGGMWRKYDLVLE